MPFVDFIKDDDGLNTSGVGGKTRFMDYIPDPKPTQHDVKLVDKIAEEVVAATDVTSDEVAEEIMDAMDVTVDEEIDVDEETDVDVDDVDEETDVDVDDVDEDDDDEVQPKKVRSGKSGKSRK